GAVDAAERPGLGDAEPGGVAAPDQHPTRGRRARRRPAARELLHQRAAAAMSWDVVVVGGGHNGLVAAGYLAGSGLKVLVLEARRCLGGPVATVEFMPGYFSTISNSPGSLEPKIVQDLELERHGLAFVRP